MMLIMHYNYSIFNIINFIYYNFYSLLKFIYICIFKLFKYLLFFYCIFYFN